MLKPGHIRAMSKVGIVAAMLTLAGSARQQVKPFLVYHDGDDILFTPETTGTRQMAKFGPWDLGERLSPNDDKLQDQRLNLYVVFPGGQYRSVLHPQYNHTLVVNKYTVEGQAREWDIFWCLVLDPGLRDDLRGERELIVAAHQRFRTQDDFQIRQIPSHGVLEETMSVTSVDGLKRFRRKDGSLPRLLIVPAHLAVRATAKKEEAGGN